MPHTATGWLTGDRCSHGGATRYAATHGAFGVWMTGRRRLWASRSTLHSGDLTDVEFEDAVGFSWESLAARSHDGSATQLDAALRDASRRRAPRGSRTPASQPDSAACSMAFTNAQEPGADGAPWS